MHFSVILSKMHEKKLEKDTEKKHLSVKRQVYP